MSFLANLARQQRKNEQLTPFAAPINISQEEAAGGLAGMTREPYRVGGPINSAITPSSRNYLDMASSTVYRGY